jgi:hypothetical protein
LHQARPTVSNYGNYWAQTTHTHRCSGPNQMGRTLSLLL